MFICSNSDRQDTEASADLPLMRRLPAGWGGFQIALLKLNSPAGTQDTPGELAIVPGPWGGCPSYRGEGIEVPSRQHSRLTLTTPDQGQGQWEVSPPLHPPTPQKPPTQPSGQACRTHEVESWPCDAPTHVWSPAPRAATLLSRADHARAGLTPVPCLAVFDEKWNHFYRTQGHITCGFAFLEKWLIGHTGTMPCPCRKAVVLQVAPALPSGQGQSPPLIPGHRQTPKPHTVTGCCSQG